MKKKDEPDWRVQAVKLLWRILLAVIALLFIAGLINTWIIFITQ